MGGSSGKGNSASRSASSSTSTTTYNVDNSVRTSDFGAIEGAVEISKEALDLGARSVDSSTELAGRGLDFAQDVNRDSLDYSRDITTTAIDRVADFAELGQQTVVDAVGGLFDRSVGAISDLAMQTSQSTDDRVAKVAVYAFLAAAAAVVLPAVFKRA
jgi:hypothetical protein